ncbi:MAG: hypothetical protein FWG79_02825 [Bacteroidales bacterium]|nr:hypothetical protein [Bacteroidales bacterium]
MKKTLKIIFGIVVAFIVFSVIVATCSDNETTAEKTSAAAESTNTPEATQSKTKSGWKYSEEIDQMDNSKKKFASLISDNSIKFDFPYGNSDFTLLLRSTKGGTDVILACSDCQFIAGFSGEKTYRVKFDDEAPINISASYSSSGSSDIVFLGNTARFISKLKNSSKIIIEPEFYDTGLKQITFSTSGLNWD